MRLATTIIAVVFGFTLLSIGAELMTAASALNATLEREHANDPLAADTSVGPDFRLATFYLIVGGVLVVAGALAFATGWGAAVLAFIATIIGGLGSTEEGASILLMIAPPAISAIIAVIAALGAHDEAHDARRRADDQARVWYRQQ